MSSSQVAPLPAVGDAPHADDATSVKDEQNLAAVADTESQATQQVVDHTHHTSYIFARLRRDMPAPSKMRQHAIYGALMLSMLLCGWNEGSTGPLIPRLQQYYNINYLVMSLVYTTMFVGAMIGGLSNIWITDRIGFGLICPLGALSQSIAYLLMGTGGPYGLFLVAFVFNGFGLAVQDAQVNNLTTRLPHAHTKMSFVQACFGLGGMVSPFISTPFAAHVKDVYRYYFVAMGIGIIAMVLMLLAFDRRTEEQLVGKLDIAAIEGRKEEVVELPVVEKKEDDAPEESNHDRAIRLAQAGTVGEAGAAGDAVVAATGDTVTEPKAKVTSGEKMKRMLTTPTVYALMAWSFVYIGVEVSISGWLTTYLVRERGANANAGFAVTGFWGGMTVGRIVLIPFTNKVGYQFSIYFYSLIAIALEFVIWYTKSVVGNSICFAFVGFFMGPVYPVALIKLSEILDDDIRGGVMGMMGSMGGAGAAAVPFITGAVSDRFGIWTLQPNRRQHDRRVHPPLDDGPTPQDRQQEVDGRYSSK